MRKSDIASGEPFLHPKFLSSLIRYCKENLGVDASVSSVTVARSPRSGCRRTPSGWISWRSPVILLMLRQTSKLGAVKTKKRRPAMSNRGVIRDLPLRAQAQHCSQYLQLD
ncbi:radical s-adenosyl methionine domain-containing protein 2 [Alternaria burnsii]|uniref:Radical s-adenosyl methionine domain-containing protein 2 n=1 Tax=Alternaria burnsii TaxID=1187904 RepID=A0A8H7B9W7_9PLEO|nr:radical s-adenosyl methionine domain-containing protein 2 [Alternaria burnsii]KAF7677789.1 radical s-adenosyl methionine domain-containing protein 2 [Alternaria burnsii]